MNYSYREARLENARHFCKSGDWPQAARKFEALRQAFPDDPEVMEELALCYRYLGLTERANVTLQEAMFVCQ